MCVMDVKVAGAIAVAILGLIVYFRKKALDAIVDSVQADTKGQDKILKENQDEVSKKIDEVNKRDDSGLSKEERAKRWD